MEIIKGKKKTILQLISTINYHCTVCFVEVQKGLKKVIFSEVYRLCAKR